jgi:hypothetical protein
MEAAMQHDPNQLAGCKREVEDCCRLLDSDLSVNDRVAVLRRLQHAQQLLRELEDEMLLLIME